MLWRFHRLWRTDKCSFGQIQNLIWDVCRTHKQFLWLLVWFTFTSISYQIIFLNGVIFNEWKDRPHLYASHVHPHRRAGLIPFLLSNKIVVKYKTCICLICRWSQLDLLSYHSWIYFTKILQRSEPLSDISYSVLSVEGMMSGMANKVCVKSLNKAWNWQDACLSEPPALQQQTGTAAHLQTARLPFGLPLKCPALWVNTFNAENDFIHFPL